MVGFLHSLPWWLPPWIKQAEGAFVVGLNKIRVDSMLKGFLPKFKRAGLFEGRSPEEAQELFNGIARMVTRSSGRGNVGSARSWLPFLNSFFYSVSLQASRIQYVNLMLNPKTNPIVRKEAIRM